MAFRGRLVLRKVALEKRGWVFAQNVVGQGGRATHPVLGRARGSNLSWLVRQCELMEREPPPEASELRRIVAAMLERARWKKTLHRNQGAMCAVTHDRWIADLERVLALLGGG